MRLALIMGMVAPYRVPVLSRVADALDGDLHVLACAAQEKGRRWQIGHGGLRVDTLKGLQIPLGSAFVMHINPGVITWLRRLQPRVLCITGFTPTMLLAAAYAGRRGIPYVLQIDAWAGGDPRHRSPVHRLLRRKVVGGSAAGIALGEKGRRWLSSFGLPEEATFLSPLVTEWPPPAAVPTMAERPFDLLWCGTLEHRKGIDVFVAVAQALHRRRDRLAVRIVGDGPRARWCNDALRASGVTVQWDGFLQRKAVREAYLSARLFLFPTRLDPFGLVATEAAQCGTPVIVSPHAGAAGDVVLDGVNGRVLPLEVEVWVSAIEVILADPDLWSAMSARGRQITAGITPELAAHGMLKAFAFAAGQ
jgi:glycosyltransferase involved in cell wall biosynthesis